MSGKISIALCTYNGAKFLEQQLKSFARQTRLPDELIVCDDRSKDKTIEIVEEFARTVSFPVKIFVNENNLGSTKNFERAVALCAGDLIFLSDQDDVWMPEKLAVIEAEFDKNPRAGMVFSDAEIVDENLQSQNCDLWQFTFPPERREIAGRGAFLEVLLRQNVVTGATMAFRAEWREKFAPIPEGIPNLIHDGWIALVIAANAETIFLETNLVKYRQHSNQQLGIDYQTALRRSFDERKNKYAAGIEVGAREVERLEQMKKVFDDYPQFAQHRGKIAFDDLIAEKHEQIKHYQARFDLPLAREKRLIPVIKELSSGRYGRFSKGFLSAAKDLIEKW